MFGVDASIMSLSFKELSNKIILHWVLTGGRPRTSCCACPGGSGHFLWSLWGSLGPPGRLKVFSWATLESPKNIWGARPPAPWQLSHGPRRIQHKATSTPPYTPTASPLTSQSDPRASQQHSRRTHERPRANQERPKKRNPSRVRKRSP